MSIEMENRLRDLERRLAELERRLTATRGTGPGLRHAGNGGTTAPGSETQPAKARRPR